MRTAAILPVKHFAQAKQRLGLSVTEALRLRLAQAMVADVLFALGRVEAIELVIVVTRESSVAAAAREMGAIVVDDHTEAGQSAAASLGIASALLEGFERVLCVPGDCPALDPAELDALIATQTSAPEVVIVPDRHGTGTNGLLLSPPDVIEPAFGPDSCERHLTLARASGAPCRLERPPSLLLDIDTGADLAVLRERLGGPHPRAARTRTVLGAPARGELLSQSAGS